MIGDETEVKKKKERDGERCIKGEEKHWGVGKNNKKKYIRASRDFLNLIRKI